jgi:glucose-6-phosphate 1-dehydrogenase
MKLDYQESINERFPQAYERLLMDIVRGNQTLFMSNNELSASWDWVESIINSLEKTNHKMTLYSAGTNGPGEQVLTNNDSWNL